MVERADEVVDLRVEGGVGEAEDVGRVGGANEFAFEGDEDVEGGSVFELQAGGFDEVGFVAGGQGGEGGLGGGFKLGVKR